MARRGTQSLVLEVSANVSQLTTGAKAARSVLNELKGDFTNLEAVVDRTWADLGGNAAAGARQVEREWNKMFRSVAANANAIKAESSQDFALQLFDVGAADERVRSLREQAEHLRTVSARAREAALAGGEYAQKQGEIAAAALLAAKNIEAEAIELDQNAMAFREIVGGMSAAEQAGNRVAANANLQRVGLQQLSFQVADVGASYASGIKPMVIFAQQGTQVVQSLALMTGGAGRFGAFLTGPWGFALMGAASIAGILATSLLNAKDAVEQTEFATDAMADAQSILGRVMDLTTGKINTQSKALLALARAQLIAGQIKARSDMADARSEMGGITQYRAKVSGGMGGGLHLSRTRGTEADIVEAFRDGTLNETEAVRGLESLLDTGLINEDAFLKASKAVTDFAVAQGNLGYFEEAEKLLDGTGGTSLLKPDKPDRPRKTKDDSAKLAREALERERRQQDALTQADAGILGALLKRAETEDARLALQLEMLQGEQAAREGALDRQVKDGELTEALASELKAKWRTVDMLEEEALRAEKRQNDLDRQLAAEQAEITGQADLLRLQAQLATSLEARERIARQILELELAERTKIANRLQLSDDPTDREEGRRMLDQIASERPLREQDIDRQYADPVEQYLEKLRYSAEHTNEVLDEVRADGLQSLEDGLVGIISGTESVAGAFKKMANQIVADLIRIAVQRAILGSIGGGFLSFLGIGGGGASQLLNPFGDVYAEGGRIEGYAGGGRLVRGPGTGTSDSILALVDGKKPILVSNGESINTAAATSRYWPLIEAMNKGALPGFAEGGLVTPTVPRLARLPAIESLQVSGSKGQDGETVVRLQLTDDLDARIVSGASRVVIETAPQVIKAATANTSRQLRRKHL